MSCAGVEQSDAVVLLYTEGVLSRPWCLLELNAAATNNIPIVVIGIANSFAGATSDIAKICDDLPGFLSRTNPSATEVLGEFHLDAATISTNIREKLTAAKALTYDPHQSSVVMQSQMQELAGALVECSEGKENEELLPDMTPKEAEEWQISRRYAVYIVHEDGSAVVTEQAHGVKDWLVQRTELEEHQVTTQGDTQNDHGRGVNDVAQHDVATVAADCDCVLLLQTSQVLKQPRCLARLYTAVKHSIPIVPVVLLSSDKEHSDLLYNFEAVKPYLNALDDGLDQAAADALYEACGAKALGLGTTLATVLPNIISKPLGLYECTEPGRLLHHRQDVNAQMAEVEQTVHRAIDAANSAAAAVAADGAATPAAAGEAGEKDDGGDEGLVPPARP